ncbi:Coiled-coil domain-containing protein 90B, mitochondrial [Linum perenne]
MALCKRLVQSGAHLFKLRLLDATHKSSFFTPGKFEHSRNISELVRSNTPKRAFLVDTLALVRVLESHQVPSKQAETITTAIVAVLNDSLESLSHSCVSKEEMQKSAMIQDSSLSKFKVEVQSSQVAREMIQDSNFSKFQNELQSSLAKFQYEIDKGIAGQRLDLNLERGRTRDELANQKAETTNLTNKSDREIHALRAQVEAAKYEIIKYCIGTLVSISAVGLAVIRILM